MSNLFDPWNKPVIGPQPEEDMFSGLDPRVAEHMRNKQAAEQGMERANTISALSGIGESAINAMTNKPAIYENRMQDLGNAPKVSQGQGIKLDTSGLREAASKKLDAARHDAGDAVKVAFEQRKAQLAQQAAASQAAKEDAWKTKDFEYKVQKDKADRDLKRQEIIAGRENAAGIRAQAQEDRLNAKLEERQYKEGQVRSQADAKRKDQVVEVEDRRVNIKQNIALLKKMIEDNGTYEMFGSHNQDIDRMVEQVATDMAKLSDPQSVARPQEVEAVKKNLVQSGFQNTNSTALDLLSNFENEVDARADTAYRIRGLTPPSLAPDEKVTPPANSGLNSDEQSELEQLEAIAKQKGW